jgi:hypothetical protein
LDSLPPPQPTTYVYAPGDIYPRGSREGELCDRAGRPDLLYLGGLLALDVAGFWAGSTATVKYSDSIAVRFSGPVMIGAVWGATLGGGWLALPKCDPHWVGSPPREGNIRADWPLALSIALLAGATAPIANAIAIGTCNPPACTTGYPDSWSTFEREMHIVAASLAGFGGALLPYLIPPRTWSAAREIDRLRFGADSRGGVFIGYDATF